MSSSTQAPKSSQTKSSKGISQRRPLTVVDELVPCCGLVCFFASIYYQIPRCVGCMSRNVCCCIYQETVLCKFATEEGFDCIFCKSECTSITGGSGHCCQCIQQCFFLDIRYSTESHEEHPCLLSVCFLTCCFNNQSVCRFCTSLKGIQDGIVVKQKKEADVKRRVQDLVAGESPSNDDNNHHDNNDKGRPESGRSEFSYGDVCEDQRFSDVTDPDFYMVSVPESPS